MGIFGFIWKVITFPFWLIFRKKEKPIETPASLTPLSSRASALPAGYPSISDTNLENLRAKVDLMLTQIDNLKIEYEAINQRMQNIERMVKEIYTMAKS